MNENDVPKIFGSPITDKERTQTAIGPDVKHTRRTFKQYIELLGIAPSDLGKTVLDLGAGMNEAFSKEATLRGIQVTSVNPKLVLPEVAKEATSPLKVRRFRLSRLKEVFWQRRSVAAVAQALPFQDKAFDSVVAVETFGYLPQNDAEYYAAFREMVRVLKPGGKVFINSAWLNTPRANSFKMMFERLKQEYGISYRFPRLEEKKKNLDVIIKTNLVVNSNLIISRPK